MNEGANIVYLGSSVLIREPGDAKVTNGYNRTELSRRYWIQKNNRSAALELLRRGYKAPEYANLYLLGPPRETFTETFCAFDCTFSGILEQNEGGNGPLYERIERPQNLVEISSTVVYLQPVYKIYYTLRADAEARVFRRELTNPDTVDARDQTTGELIVYEGADFFWEAYDIQRNNFDLYDEVIESWRLTHLSST